jgi:hypothetical protein
MWLGKNVTSNIKKTALKETVVSSCLAIIRHAIETDWIARVE